jgi:TolB-like protein
LAGQSNCLKEYTIGLNILNKQKDFNPQENGIVRIHAGRLRRALAQYYINRGAQDVIRIYLPKGNYVPVFSENTDHLLRFCKIENPKEPHNLFDSGNTYMVSILPFHYQHGKEGLKNFADGLGGLLSHSLKTIKNFSVISYNAIRLIAEKVSGVKEISAVFGAHFVFTGAIQCQKNMSRITVEMFRAETAEQLWSLMFERHITDNNLFEVQDEIIHHIMDELYRSGILKPDKMESESIVEVA